MPTIRPTRCIRITIPDPLRYWRCRRCPGHVWNARRFPGGAAAAPAVLATLADDTEIPPTRQPRAPYISISGTTSGGSGPVRVMWHKSTGLLGYGIRFGELERLCRATHHRWKPDHCHGDGRGGRHGVAADLGHAAATARTGAGRTGHRPQPRRPRRHHPRRQRPLSQRRPAHQATHCHRGSSSPTRGPASWRQLQMPFPSRASRRTILELPRLRRSSAGASGVKFGTLSWTARGMPLLHGNNVITIRALNAAGNRRSVTIVRRNGAAGGYRSNRALRLRRQHAHAWRESPNCPRTRR